MVKNFKEVREFAKKKNNIKIAIAGAREEEINLAIRVKEEGIADFVLIGIENQIKKMISDEGRNPFDYEVLNAENDVQACAFAISLTKEGKVNMPMKGLLHTATFMKAVLNKEAGLDFKRRASQVTVFDDKSGKLKFLTDCAINVDQGVKIKKDIIENAVEIATSFGCTMPKVALLGAAETVNLGIEDTLNSAILTQMNRRGQIKNCKVDGPLSLDNAIDLEAAKHKGIESSVAGMADILVGASLGEANTLSKSLHYYAHFETASIIGGSKNPFIMTSRTDELENKINSIASTILTL